MEEPRICGDCAVCCFVAEVKEGVVNKPACQTCPFLDKGCRLFNDSKRPAVCKSFRCAWLHGSGSLKDRPDKSGVMVSINDLNGGGSWIVVMNLKPKAHLTTGKNIIVETANRINLPVIVVEYDHLKDGKGDYVIINESLESRSNKIRGDFIVQYTDTMKVYSLIITPSVKA